VCWERLLVVGGVQGLNKEGADRCDLFFCCFVVGPEKEVNKKTQKEVGGIVVAISF
jgi:hypothetical protein